MASRPKAPPRRIPKYGRSWPSTATKAAVELRCFLDGKTNHPGGRFFHFKEAAKYFYPAMEWNPWMEDQIKSLCDPAYEHRQGDTTVRFISWTGCGAAGKTHSAGFFAKMWWMAAPKQSSVTLTSTSKTAIGQRVWPVIQRLYAEHIDPSTGEHSEQGHLIDSSKVLQAVKGDSKHAIHALAVEKGELQKAINSIKGRHTPRMMLVIDEANTTPQAVFETISNMAKGCKELVVLIIGNAILRFDNHGRCCEPSGGWGTVNVEASHWPTKGVPEWDIMPGLCCHYDGEKSPNVVAKKTLWPYIYTYENFLRRRQSLKSVSYWSQDRGFWPPASDVSTVFQEVMFENSPARGSFTFISHSTPIAFLDSAFGGDACKAVFGRFGDVSGGKLGIQIDDHMEFEPEAESLSPIDHQIARWFIRQCKQRSVEPRCAGLDATGTGRGAYAIVAEEWSSEVRRVEWGGSVSDLPASEDDPRPAKEVYDRKVTELWMRVRAVLLADQIRGLYQRAIEDFCTRRYEMFGKKFKLHKKEEMKKDLGRSPDDGDAVSGLVEIAALNGLRVGSEIPQRRTETWQALQRELTSVYDNAYAEEADYSSDYG